jgi:hypothetical protein
MLHHQRVGVQGCEWLPVTLPPLPKDQPRCRGFDQRRGHDSDGIGLLAEAHLSWSHKGSIDNVGRWSRARWVGLRDGVEALHPYAAAAAMLGHEQLQRIGL